MHFSLSIELKQKCGSETLIISAAFTPIKSKFYHKRKILEYGDYCDKQDIFDPLWANLVTHTKKNKTVCLRQSLGPKIMNNCNILSSMMMFTFFVFDQKYLFRANLIKNLVCLR